MKRIKVRRIKPNPLFEQWLKEWKDSAVNDGSDKQYNFAKALNSLQKYPLPLNSGKDCVILQHFGAKLCAMLDKKLLDHKKQYQDISMTSEFIVNFERSKSSPSPRKKFAGNSPYAEDETAATIDEPFRRWWNLCDYAILFLLYRKTNDAGYIGYVTQTELLLELQHYLNCLDEIRYSKELYENQIKSSVSTLTSEGVVKIESNKGIMLTEYGKSLSKRSLLNENILENLIKSCEMLIPGQSWLKSVDIQALLSVARKSNATLDSSDSANDSQKSVESSEKNGEVLLNADTFDVVLLIDVQEVPGKKTELPENIEEICQRDILFEVRSLKVGDFLWVARCRRTKKELVLPYIVERKRIDDLSGSIIDGRFHEQKFRLKRCAIENVIYVVENYKHARTTISLPALMQASTNSVVQDGFVVKYTKSHRATMAYLASMSKILTTMYQGKKLSNYPMGHIMEHDIGSAVLMEFEDFNKTSSKIKKFTVEEMFVRHFLQIKGISVQKATAIIQRYPTPSALVKAIEDAGENGEKLLANMVVEEKGRQISATNSKLIYEFYTKRELL